MARANTYDSSAPGIYYYPDRKWQAVPSGMTYKFERDGVPQIDARNNVYYMAAGNSPAMMEKNVGQGSQYLWTYRDAAGEYLDGAKNYRLHVLPGVPAKNFWSVVVYDALSRSELQNGQPLPSVSSYTSPHVNPTDRSTFSLARTSRRRRATGYRPFLAGDGFRSSASIALPSRSSTRHGSSRTSSPCRNDGRRNEQDRVRKSRTRVEHCIRADSSIKVRTNFYFASRTDARSIVARRGRDLGHAGSQCRADVPGDARTPRRTSTRSSTGLGR